MFIVEVLISGVVVPDCIILEEIAQAVAYVGAVKVRFLSKLDLDKQFPCQWFCSSF